MAHLFIVGGNGVLGSATAKYFLKEGLSSQNVKGVLANKYFASFLKRVNNTTNFKPIMYLKLPAKKTRNKNS